MRQGAKEAAAPGTGCCQDTIQLLYSSLQHKKT